MSSHYAMCKYDDATGRYIPLEVRPVADKLKKDDPLYQEGFQAGAASRDAEVARLKTVPMKYRRMEFNAQLQKENDQLRAEINKLRESTELLLIARQIGHYRDEWDMLKEALAATPEQSLAEYRNKVIEDCAVKADALANCEENTDGYRNGAAWCAEAIRAMKEKP